MHEPGNEPASARLGDYEGDYVEFWPAGVAASGRFSCAACGNVVTVRTVVPRCMLCGERLWERVASSPVSKVETRTSY